LHDTVGVGRAAPGDGLGRGAVGRRGQGAVCHPHRGAAGGLWPDGGGVIARDAAAVRPLPSPPPHHPPQSPRIGCSLGSKQATDEEAQDILAEVAPSGELALDTFESLAQGKKEFPDSQRALQQAFETIGGPESAKSGQVDADKLRAVLTTFGCKLSEEEVDDLLARASSAGGKFDVADFLSQCFA